MAQIALAIALASQLLLPPWSEPGIERTTGEQNRLYELHLDKPSAWFVMEPELLQVKSFNVTGQDYQQALVFWSGTYSRIRIVTVANGESLPVVTQYVVELQPRPGPDPPGPGPAPLPTGFAAEVFRVVSSLPVDWRTETAEILETVSSSAAAGGLKTLDDVVSEIVHLTGQEPKASKPFWDLLKSKLTSIEAAVSTLTAAVEGLRHG